jgi:hypothetical protein
MLTNILWPVGQTSDLQVKFFFSYAWTSWKLQIFTKSRAITLKKKQNKVTSESTGAQLHKLSNIPLTFHEPRSNSFWATCDTSWKLQIFTKSRAITLTKQNKFTSETPGTQRHMLSNILVKFNDSRLNTFWVTWDTTQVENSKFSLSQGQ